MYNIIVFNESPYGDLKKELIKIGVKLYFLPEDKKTIPERFIYLYKLVKKINPILIHSWTIHDNAYAGILGRIFTLNLLVHLEVRFMEQGLQNFLIFLNKLLLGLLIFLL